MKPFSVFGQYSRSGIEKTIFSLIMMEAAGLNIAFNAKSCVRERADVVIAGDDLREILPHINRFKEMKEGVFPTLQWVTH